MSIPNDRTGVILMTYGSAGTAEGVLPYLSHIYKGAAPAELAEEFKRRYSFVDRSPLIEITERQAADLERYLGGRCAVRAGMLHSAPYIDEAVAACASAGATRLIGVILSPQYSPVIMGGYRQTFEKAAGRHGYAQERAALADPWPVEPHFIDLLASHITKSLAMLEEQYGKPVPSIFTTHSLPQRVVQKDPAYLGQLAQTIDAVLGRLGQIEYYAAYQSAGHTPEEWLKPDLVDILDELSRQKTPAALIVPIQFVADHLEVLYDLDIAAREQCEARGIAYHRIPLPNTDPLFISALAHVVRNTESGAER